MGYSRSDSALPSQAQHAAFLSWAAPAGVTTLDELERDGYVGADGRLRFVADVRRDYCSFRCGTQSAFSGDDSRLVGRCSARLDRACVGALRHQRRHVRAG